MLISRNKHHVNCKLRTGNKSNRSGCVVDFRPRKAPARKKLGQVRWRTNDKCGSRTRGWQRCITGPQGTPVTWFTSTSRPLTIYGRSKPRRCTSAAEATADIFVIWTSFPPQSEHDSSFPVVRPPIHTLLHDVMRRPGRALQLQLHYVRVRVSFGSVIQ